ESARELDEQDPADDDEPEPVALVELLLRCPGDGCRISLLGRWNCCGGAGTFHASKLPCRRSCRRSVDQVKYRTRRTRVATSSAPEAVGSHRSSSCAAGRRSWQLARTPVAMGPPPDLAGLDLEANLPSLPAAALEVVHVCSDPDADIAQLAHVLERDPTLAGQVLRVANTAHYYRGRPVTSLDRAAM